MTLLSHLIHVFSHLFTMIGKDEEPGLLKLLNPVKREGKPDLADIELWPRCVPDGMIFKVLEGARERSWCCLIH